MAHAQRYSLSRVVQAQRMQDIVGIWKDLYLYFVKKLSKKWYILKGTLYSVHTKSA
jgi:hypothetical protein